MNGKIFIRPNYLKSQKTYKAENSLGRKHCRKMSAGKPLLAPHSLRSTRTHFSAIISHLNNNWAICIRKMYLCSLFTKGQKLNSAFLAIQLFEFLWYFFNIRPYILASWIFWFWPFDFGLLSFGLPYRARVGIYVCSKMGYVVSTETPI